MRQWCHRSSRVGLACLFLLVAVAAAPPARSPFAGTWKVTLPNPPSEVTLWLVEVDPQAKKIAFVSGLGEHIKSKLSDFRADASTCSFVASTGTVQYRIAARAPKGKEADLLRGSVRVGSNVMPAWFQRTTLRELTEGNAIRESPGVVALEKVMNLGEGNDRTKLLRSIAARYPGSPVHFLALQTIIGDLLRQKADVESIKSAVASYRALSLTHGVEMLVGANLDLARNLLNHEKTIPLAVESAREAVKLVRPGEPTALRVTTQMTLAVCLHRAGKTDELPAIAQTLGKLGEEMIKTAKGIDEQLATQQMAVILLASPAAPVVDKGLEFARKAIKLLKEDMPVVRRADAHRLLYRSLCALGKTEEATKLAPTLEKLEVAVDREYLKETLSFKIDKYPGRKSKSERVVLVELFTGAQYPPALAASIGFDAAMQAYQIKEVAFIQYHVGFPEPDSLVSPDSETRKTSYKSDLTGVPGMFVDGRLTLPIGGALQAGKNSFAVVREAINQALERRADARIKLDVTRKGELITARADISGLRETGSAIRLRLALVEEVVRYQGISGVRLHHHLVRGFLGGPNGFRLDKKEMSQSASIALAQLRKSLGDYLTDLAKKAGVTRPEIPLELKKLKVIAFIQHEDTKQILQAAQADVP